MDRNLPENHSFRLNEDSASNNDGKWLIFVKLTDSCMKTIENVIKSNKKALTSNKANIKFHLHGGVNDIPFVRHFFHLSPLSLTSRKSLFPRRPTNGKRIHFKFVPKRRHLKYFNAFDRSIASNEKGETQSVSSVLLCSQLESCGLIEQRMNIQAQEDVYSMTKTKVTEFHKHEELNKKQCVVLPRIVIDDHLHCVLLEQKKLVKVRKPFSKRKTRNRRIRVHQSIKCPHRPRKTNLSHPSRTHHPQFLRCRNRSRLPLQQQRDQQQHQQPVKISEVLA